MLISPCKDQIMNIPCPIPTCNVKNFITPLKIINNIVAFEMRGSTVGTQLFDLKIDY